MSKIRVGRSRVKPTTGSHSWRVQQGNQGPYHENVGHHKDGTADARRSTGVHPKKHNAILPIMPNLPPG
jgi:hypothetical protein